MIRRGTAGPDPRIKICGLTRNSDARRAEALGADLLGFVLTPGFGRSVSREAAASVAEGTSGRRVAVLVDETPDGAAKAASALGASVLQLHGTENRETMRALRERGSWTLWKAVRAQSVDDVRSAVDAVGDLVDGILIEGWRRGVMGGAGVRLRLEPDDVREALPVGVDFILAGGLEPPSVAEAVARFRPDVVDVSSGVEDDVGLKSDRRMEAFIRAVRVGMPPG